MMEEPLPILERLTQRVLPQHMHAGLTMPVHVTILSEVCYKQMYEHIT